MTPTLRDRGIYRFDGSLWIITEEDSELTPTVRYSGQRWPVVRLDDEPELWIEDGDNVSDMDDTGWTAAAESVDLFRSPGGSFLDTSTMSDEQRARALGEVIDGYGAP